MTDGLKILKLPSGGYYGVTRVGWLRRVSGDEWELIDARTVVRTSGSRSLGELAADGPKNDHRVGPADKEPEEVHRLIIRRSLVADADAWVDHCPMPKDWKASP